jgi:hypothetical protein
MLLKQLCHNLFHFYACKDIYYEICGNKLQEMSSEVSEHWSLTGSSTLTWKLGYMAIRVCEPHSVQHFTDLLPDSSASPLL